jgi:DNA repair protein RecO (recombination protein O)
MILKTEGIALRVRPWSRTSHIVTWLTPDHGRVTTAVKGACRVKSAFLGQYDLAYTCELLFYRRDHEGVHAMRECAPLEAREPLRRDWRAAAAASYLCDLAARVAWPQHQDADGHYRLLTDALDRLCREPPDPARVLAHEIALLDHLGLMPNLARCPACHTPEVVWLRFSVAAGRLLCGHVQGAAASESVMTLHRDVIDTLAAWQAGTPPLAGMPDHLALGIGRFLGIFMGHHLDVAPASRRALFEWLAINPKTWGTSPKERRL